MRGRRSSSANPPYPPPTLIVSTSKITSSPAQTPSPADKLNNPSSSCWWHAWKLCLVCIWLYGTVPETLSLACRYAYVSVLITKSCPWSIESRQGLNLFKKPAIIYLCRQLEFPRYIVHVLQIPYPYILWQDSTSNKHPSVSRSQLWYCTSSLSFAITHLSRLKIPNAILRSE